MSSVFLSFVFISGQCNVKLVGKYERDSRNSENAYRSGWRRTYHEINLKVWSLFSRWCHVVLLRCPKQILRRHVEYEGVARQQALS